METKTIKGVDEEIWMRFKALAARNRLPMGKLLTDMVKEHEKKSEEFWDKILHAGKILSDKEAEEINKISRKIRKEKGFRNVPNF